MVKPITTAGSPNEPPYSCEPPYTCRHAREIRIHQIIPFRSPPIEGSDGSFESTSEPLKLVRFFRGCHDLLMPVFNVSDQFPVALFDTVTMMQFVDKEKLLKTEYLPLAANPRDFMRPVFPAFFNPSLKSILKLFVSFCLPLAFLFEPINSEGQEVTPVPLPQAHAHNDYYHSRPLLDALDNGFCSVEADVFLVGDELLVAHSKSEIRKGQTLESLYLDPLQKQVLKNGGSVFPGGPGFTLLVDFKSDGKETYAVLRTKLHAYRKMLSRVENGTFHPGAVQIVVSGNRPFQAITEDAIRYVGVDGRLSDLGSTNPSHLMPMISDRWSSHFQWRGKGEFTSKERIQLHEIVARAHAANRRVRFWATPENPLVWNELQSAGVDHINTDQLEALRKHLSNPQQPRDKDRQ